MIKFIQKNAKHLTTAGAFVLLVICYFQQKQNANLRAQLKTPSTLNVDSLVKVNDSLHMELLPAQIELGRYQVAFTIFAERNPKAAEQYGTIISEETE